MEKYADDVFGSSDSDYNEGQFSCQMYQNEAKSMNKHTKKQIEPWQYREYPYNTSGIVRIQHKKQNSEYTKIGNGFLISGLLVVTSAHLICFPTKQNEMVCADVVQFQSRSKGFAEPFRVKVRDFRVHPKFEQIQRQRMRLIIQKRKLKQDIKMPNEQISKTLKNLRKQIYCLCKQNQKYDISLLRLAEEIVLPQYPIFEDARSYKLQKISMCCFREKQVKNNLYIIQPQTTAISMSKTGGVYDIDSSGGVSGSGIFLYDDNKKVIGIHKGVDRNQAKKICTLLSLEIIEQLEKWVKQFFMFQSKQNLKANKSVQLDMGIKELDPLDMSIRQHQYVHVKNLNNGDNYLIKFNNITTVQDLVKKVAVKSGLLFENINLICFGYSITYIGATKNNYNEKLIDLGFFDLITVFMKFIQRG